MNSIVLRLRRLPLFLTFCRLMLYHDLSSGEIRAQKPREGAEAPAKEWDAGNNYIGASMVGFRINLTG